MLSEIVVLACLASAPVEPSADAEIVERVLAVVDRRPVLLTEVRTMSALKGVGEAAALDALIDEMLMYAEARRYPQAQPTAAEEDAALMSLRSARARGLSAEELGRVARRQATILKYVGLRFRPLIHVSDEAVQQAFDAEAAAAPSPPSFAERAPVIRERLAARELDARIEEWVRQLRGSADVRYVETGPGPGR
jgi:hypothetical protein